MIDEYTLPIAERATMHGKSFTDELRHLKDTFEGGEAYDDYIQNSEDVEQYIHEYPLAIEDFHCGDRSVILLGTGGPACRVRQIPESNHSFKFVYEFQDWFEPWTIADLDWKQEELIQWFFQFLRLRRRVRHKMQLR